ncbi:MAG TPA: hypothetical protein VGU25_14600 [Acidobacteriaceae bacterium]|nr:hypothetical protein [Acidobacteriaceae bacterium]
MKRFVVVVLSLIAFVCIVGGAFYWRLDHSFSFAIHWKGERSCHGRQPCIFTLADVFPGDWDRIVIFDMNASQAEVDSVVGEGTTRPDLQRFIVFMKGGSVVHMMTEPQSFERPSDGEAAFDGIPLTENHYIIPRNAAFVMARGDGEVDVLELLKPDEVVE